MTGTIKISITKTFTSGTLEGMTITETIEREPKSSSDLWLDFKGSSVTGSICGPGYHVDDVVITNN